MAWEDFVLIGVAGVIAVCILVIVGFLISVRRQGCSVRVKWHKRLVLNRVNKISKIFYLILVRSSCQSCPMTSFCLGS
jgi:ABC-type methionine transport system permease subunit